MSSLKKRIIPCLDVKQARVVKGIHFRNLRDMGDPVELAIRYEQEGADEIVFLDIAATAESRPTALRWVRNVAKHLSIPFTLGGGLRAVDDIYAFLEAGADKVAVNSSAVNHPQLIDRSAHQFGSQCILVAVDIQQSQAGTFEVFSSGGRINSGRIVREWIPEIADRGAGEILLTSINRDGTGLGFDTDITQWVSEHVTIPVIASGGAQTPKHFAQAFRCGADAGLAATMFHSGAYKIGEVKDYLQKNGISVRNDFIPNKDIQEELPC